MALGDEGFTPTKGGEQRFHQLIHHREQVRQSDRDRETEFDEEIVHFGTVHRRLKLIHLSQQPRKKR